MTGRATRVPVPRTTVEPAPLLLGLDDPRWSAFVAGAGDATPFHDPSWAQLLAITYGYRGFAVAVTDGDGELIAGAPFLEVRSLTRRRRWISLPFTDECKPLALDSTSRRRFASALGIAQERLGAPRVQVRGVVEGLHWRTGADAVTHDLALNPDLERVKSTFSRSQVIRNIIRAEREGVTVRRAADRPDLISFYALHTRTRRRQGVPVQPLRFFELLWSRLVVRGLAFILLADAPGRDAVAGALFLAGGGTTIYKFGASDVDSRPLRPNHLIFWTAIQEACARGDHRFDFGRTDLDNAGLRAFKSGWGGHERPLQYSSLTAGATADGLATRALSVAIRKGPSWVCRGTGEALYRYAASK
jgi:CelD/BcsL family acetyltransferase involved in cellulose biosynthesis